MLALKEISVFSFAEELPMTGVGMVRPIFFLDCDLGLTLLRWSRENLPILAMPSK